MQKPAAHIVGPPKVATVTSAAITSAGPPQAKSSAPAKSHTDVTSDAGGT